MASFDRRWEEAVRLEFGRQPLVAGEILAEEALAGLPAPVARYVRQSGAVGRPRPQNVRAEFDALMWRAPGGAPMQAHCVQYNFYGRPARLFLMDARMFRLPVRALHLYREEAATFQVRVLDLVNMVNIAGDTISAAETVTVLNDLCAFAPGALVDPRLAWEPIDDRSSRVVFTNGPRVVAATLAFNDRDELVDFWSDDRPESAAGALVPRRWNTPFRDYAEFDGRRMMTFGATVYTRPEGPFTYGEFRLRSVAWDVAGPTEVR